MKEDAEVAVKELRANPAVRSYPEAKVRQAVIERLLRLLGWNTDDVDEVDPEYSVGGGSVDYALRLNGNSEVFIEAKRAKEDLGEHQEQLVIYTAKHGVPLAVLTNGLTWQFFLPLQKGPWEQRQFCDVGLKDPEISARLLEFLSRENVLSGAAVKSAEGRLEALRRDAAIEETLPEAWEALISDSEGLIVDLIEEKVESLCGSKPDPERIRRFLEEDVGKPRVSIADTPTTDRREEDSTRDKNFTFAEVGILVGAKLQFVDDRTTECEVADLKNRVRYKGQEYTLSGLAREIRDTKSERGPSCWQYKNETLTELRRRLKSDGGT